LTLQLKLRCTYQSAKYGFEANYNGNRHWVAWKSTRGDVAKRNLKSLDIFKFDTRDSDKVLKVRQELRKAKTGINTLQQRIDLNLGLVSIFPLLFYSGHFMLQVNALTYFLKFNNITAERDRTLQLELMSVQLEIAHNIQKDGFRGVLTAVTTALFLPMTFMAVCPQHPLLN